MRSSWLFGLAIIITRIAHAADASPQFQAVDPRMLGDFKHTFVFERDQCVPPVGSVARLRLVGSSVIAHLKNRSKANADIHVVIELFNRYGMRLGGFPIDIAAVAPQQMCIREGHIELPALDEIYQLSSVALPRDWPVVKFARIHDVGETDFGGLDARAAAHLVRHVEVGPPSMGAQFELEPANPKLNGFGNYLMELMRAVSDNWNSALKKMNPPPPPGSVILVQIAVNGAGEVTHVETVDNHTSKLGERAILEAIASHRLPAWSPEMKAVLKPEELITFICTY